MESVIILLCFVGSIFLVAIILLASSIRILRGNTRLSVYRLGQYLGDKGPGIVFLIPFIDRGVIKELGVMDKTADKDSSVH